MPVGRAVAAIGRAAGNVDDPPPDATFAPVQDRAAGEVGGRLQVDLHGARPGGLPVGQGRINGGRLEHAGIVDQHIDPAVETGESCIPEPVSGGGIRQVRSDHLWPILPSVTNQKGAMLQGVCDRRADAARGAGDEDVGKRVDHDSG